MGMRSGKPNPTSRGSPRTEAGRRCPRCRVDQTNERPVRARKDARQNARAVHELVKAKVEHRAPQVEIASDGKPVPEVINIMDALKQSMHKKGQAKVRMLCLRA